MTNPKVEFRAATAQDAELFYGKQPIRTMRGYVAIIDDKPVGIGGVYYESGFMVAFSEMKPEMRSRKKDIARGIRMLTEMYDKLGPVFAVACKKEPTSYMLLAKLGFAPSGQTIPAGDILIRDRS